MAECHSFCLFFIFYNIHTLIQSHSYNTFIRRHSPGSLSMSSSLVACSSGGKTSLWCRAENRTLAALTYRLGVYCTLPGDGGGDREVSDFSKHENFPYCLFAKGNACCLVRNVIKFHIFSIPRKKRNSDEMAVRLVFFRLPWKIFWTEIGNHEREVANFLRTIPYCTGAP